MLAGDAKALQDAIGNGGESVRRLSIVLSGNGTALQPMLTDRIIALWERQLASEGVGITQDKKALLAFAAAGLVGMLRALGPGAIALLAARKESLALIENLLEELRR